MDDPKGYPPPRACLPRGKAGGNDNPRRVSFSEVSLY